ncbi:MAG: hypothetical protein HYX55_06180 [Chloroflexi bacterium]|nr:hypothetical protein [Chloroflexota bacterium]
MKKVLPFLFLFAGMFAIAGVLFLFVRSDSLTSKVRSFDWRKAINTTLDEPVVDVEIPV